MKRVSRIAAGILIAASALAAQTGDAPPNPLMPTAQMNQLCQRVVQLMDAGGVAVPDLQRAAAPITESAKQSCTVLEAKPGTTQPIFLLMNSVRAYLTLSDAVPKPFSTRPEAWICSPLRCDPFIIACRHAWLSR